MVISAVLRYIARQLGYLDLRFQNWLPTREPLEQTENYFSLRGFHPIHHVRDRPLIIRDWKMDQLFINEFFKPNDLLVMVDAYFGVVLLKPLFTTVSLRFTECQNNSCLFLFWLGKRVLELNYVFWQICEILLRFGVRTGAETFVVLYMVFFVLTMSWEPQLVIRDCEERLSFFLPWDFDNRGHEFLQEGRFE